MKITICFEEKDVRRVLAEHCHKQFQQFQVDVHNVEISQPEAETFVARIEGEYQPE